jgi:p-aminobenzoyl-glutamate transporter AbgT
MSLRIALRIANGTFWLWVCLSAAMMPVTNGSSDFWAAKASQLFQLNPNIQDIPRFIGNAVVLLILWFVVDLILKPKLKKKSTAP